MSVQTLELSEINNEDASGEPLLEGNYGVIKNVKVKLQVLVGETEISVDDLFALKRDSVVEIDRLAASPVDIKLDGKLVAQGNLVAVGENFGVRITNIKQ